MTFKWPNIYKPQEEWEPVTGEEWAQMIFWGIMWALLLVGSL